MLGIRWQSGPARRGGLDGKSILGLAIAAWLAGQAGAAAASTHDSVREAPVPLAAGAADGVGRRVPDLEVRPLQGPARRLSSWRDAKAVVIAFTSTTCPVTRRYLPTLAALEKEYARRGVAFIWVNPVATDPVSAMEEAVRTNGLAGPYVADGEGRWVAGLGATSTAEAFVLDAARTLAYRGAVDDQYGLGYSREAPRHAYLREALDAVLESRSPRIAATSAPGCALETRRSDPSPAVPVTYHNRISRLLQSHCTECHRAGGNAPFSLESPADVAGHAGMIRKVVERGTMPPWFAAPGPEGEPSVWANDRRLPAVDKADLLGWLADGRAEGNPADAPVPRRYPVDWEIGEPDAVFQIPEPIAVKATGQMPYQNVVVPTGLGEDRWVEALEVRPTAREVVHHVLVFVVPPDQSGGGGSTTNGAVRRRRSEDRGAGNFFAVYVPGNNVLRYPEGLAKHLPAGASLHFQIHYTPTGRATQDRTRLGVRYARTAPRHEVRVAAIAPARLRIPPGVANHEIKAVLPVPFEARLLAFMPHMHLRGKAYRYEVEEPGGPRTTLLDVPRYDFNWQLQYTLATPRPVPAGSRLHGTAWFDNSPDNPANPDPAREVTWGEQTDDEMALGYLEYYLPGVPAGQRQESLLAAAGRDGGLLFAALDKNGDGFISREESPTPQAFTQADTDGDGKVTREELGGYLQRRRRR